MATKTTKTDVLIVGLGPVGAVLAGLLAQWNIGCIAIDRDREIYKLPRAAHFDHEIMRIFQQLGIADALLPGLRPLARYEFRNADGELLLCFDQGERPTSLGWRGSYMFHQPALEMALRDALSRLPQVQCRLGTSLIAIQRNDAAGVAARIVDESGNAEIVEARFLIGADGGASTVRKLSDIPLFDFGFDEPWLVVDTVVEDEADLPQCGLQLCDPQRPTTVMPMAPGRRRWEFMLRPDEDAEAMLDDSKVMALLAPWAAARPAVIRKAVYRFHGLVAKNWRACSVLLAGDAAHQMPPFMGQGMCSGIRDAAALAWRVALVIGGQASPKLLDSYQQERDPHVRFIVQTAIGMGRIVCTMDAAAAAARDKDMIAQMNARQAYPRPPSLPGFGEGFLLPSARAGEIFPQPEIASRTHRFDDLAGRGFWLVTRKPHQPDVLFVRNHVATPDCPVIPKWLDEAGAEAALVRPDRYVFGTGAPAVLLADLHTRLRA